MAMTTTRINGTCSLDRGYKYYADVLVWDTVQSDSTFRVTVNTYLENGGTRTNSSNWTKNITVTGVGQETLTGETINTSTVDRNGGKVLLQSKTFNVAVTKTSISVSAYASRSSYSQYDPGYCSLSGNVSMPKVASTWSSSLLSIANIENAFTLPINKYVSSYYNVVEVRNNNNTILIRTINDAVNGTSVTFTSSELSTIYTMDNNANQLPLRFYMDLKTYTNSSKTTQIGSTQRLTCEAYIVNGSPTLSYTVAETDEEVLEVFGGQPNVIIRYASDLLFTITTAAQKGATISSVKVSDQTATLNNGVYQITLNNVTYDNFPIVVTDSRGLTTTQSYVKSIVNYVAPKINAGWSVERDSPTSSDLILNATINAYNDYLSENITNTVVVEYSLDNSTWVTIPNTDYTYASNLITISNLTLSNLIPYNQTGTFYLRASDSLMTHSDNQRVAVGIETISYGERDFQVNGDLIVCDEDGNNPVNILNKINNKGREKVTFDKSTIWTSNSTTNVAIPDATKTLTTYGGNLLVFASMNVEVSSNVAFIDVFVDGTRKDEIMKISSASGRQMIAGAIVIKNIASGSHTIALYVHVQNSSNTFSVYSYNNQQLTIVEL